MNIYPAIDLRKNRVVRLRQGHAEEETVYFENPIEPALLWKEAGAAWIHLVDLDGAFSGTLKNWSAIEQIVTIGLKVEIGGGMRSEGEIARAFEIGVSRVIIGSRAVDDLDFIAHLVQGYGEKIAVGIDARDGKVAVKGWVDTTATDALELAQRVASVGVQTIVYTDISRDGTLTGPNFKAQQLMLQNVPAGIIASGGVASRKDVERFVQMARTHQNLDGIVIGKALYDKKVDLADLLTLV